MPILPGPTRQAWCLLLSHGLQGSEREARLGGSHSQLRQGALPASPPSGTHKPEPAPLPSPSPSPAAPPSPFSPDAFQPTPAHAGRVLPPRRGQAAGEGGRIAPEPGPSQDQFLQGSWGPLRVAKRQLHPPSTGMCPSWFSELSVRGHARGILKSKVRRREWAQPKAPGRAMPGHLGKGIVVRLEGGGDSRG